MYNLLSCVYISLTFTLVTTVYKYFSIIYTNYIQVLHQMGYILPYSLVFKTYYVLLSSEIANLAFTMAIIFGGKRKYGCSGKCQVRWHTDHRFGNTD